MRIKRLASKFFELEKRKNQNEYKIFACVVSNVGMQRKNNEDNYILSDEINVGLEKDMTTTYEKDSKDRKWFCAGVFDGMGGGSNGELAALWAAQSFYCTFEGISPDDYESIDRKVRQCFLDANNKIVQGKPDTAMYGTTGTVFLSNGIKFRIYHIGDSRCYLYRNKELKRLTKDQTVAAMKERLGIYESDPEDIKKDRSKLTTYIGCDASMENLVPRESDWISVDSGDRILICSDGLYDMLEDWEIEQCMSQDKGVKESAKALVNKTLEKDAADNVTVLRVNFGRTSEGEQNVN